MYNARNNNVHSKANNEEATCDKVNSCSEATVTLKYFKCIGPGCSDT